VVEVLVGGSGAADADDVTGTSAACAAPYAIRLTIRHEALLYNHVIIY